jgi:hypothetical protein
MLAITPQISNTLISGGNMPQAQAAEREDAQEQDQPRARRPVWTARDGTSSVAVFANQGANGTFHTMKFEHAYKNEASGEYKPSNSFTASEAAKAIALLSAGYAKQLELDQSKGQSRG